MKQGIHPDYREVVFQDEDAGFRVSHSLNHQRQARQSPGKMETTIH